MMGKRERESAAKWFSTHAVRVHEAAYGLIRRRIAESVFAGAAFAMVERPYTFR